MNRELYYCEEEKIKELLLYRKIVKVENDTLYLDNGVELEVLANEGGGGCNSGWYSITELNECDNVITNVEFECEDIDDEYDDTSYRIFVYAEDKRINWLIDEGIVEISK